MPRAFLRMVGLSLRYGGPAIAAAALFAAPVSCGLDVAGEEVSGGSGSSTGSGGVCMPGAQQACYSGSPDTKGVGACKEGTQKCSSDGSSWGPCEGEVVPGEETCDEPGDEDCDGFANEAGVNCKCVPMQDTMSCYTGPEGTAGKGECTTGVQACNADGNGYGPCMNEVTPKAENCGTAAADEDCDEVEKADAMKPWDTDSGCNCVPGTMASCYGGPAGTENVGVCKAGMGTCNDDGITVGSCMGEVLPKAMEECGTQEDENCDGNKYCRGDTHWSKRGSGMMDQSGTGVAGDAQGNVFVGGTFSSSITFGGSDVMTTKARDVFVTKFDPAGAELFHKGFGSSGNDNLAKIAVDAGGNVIVAGWYDGDQIDFGGGPLVNVGKFDIFVAKLSPTGAHVWSKRLGGDMSDEVATGVAVTPGGDVFLTGTYTGSPDFGKGPLPASNAEDYFIAKLAAADGATLWAKGFPGAEPTLTGFVVASDAAGDAIVTTRHGGNVDLGGGMIMSPDSDILIAKFAGADGAYVWAKTFITGGFQAGRGVVADSMNNVIVTGSFQGTVNLGGGMVTAMADDIFVLKLDSAGGYVWSKAWGGGNTVQDAVDIALGDGNSLIVTGKFDTTIDFGGGNTIMGGNGDAFAVKLDAGGAVLWKKEFAGSGARTPTDVGADTAGNALVTGNFQSIIDFGGGPDTVHNSVNALDAFVVKLEK